jgi:hypothetical protein
VFFGNPQEPGTGMRLVPDWIIWNLSQNAIIKSRSLDREVPLGWLIN